MPVTDVMLKVAEPVRMAETTGVAPGYGYENINPVFEARLPLVWERLVNAGVNHGICVAYYDWPDDSGRVVVHLGFDIAAQALTNTEDVRVVELPGVEVASAIHRGRLDDFSVTFEAAVAWIDANGYQIADGSRELYLKWNRDDVCANVTELQIPVTPV